MAFKFTAGQFVRLGIQEKGTYLHKTMTPLITSKKQDHEAQGYETSGQPVDLDGYVFRAYSVASSPYDEFIEFFRSSPLRGIYQ